MRKGMAQLAKKNCNPKRPFVRHPLGSSDSARFLEKQLICPQNHNRSFEAGMEALQMNSWSMFRLIGAIDACDRTRKPREFTSQAIQGSAPSQKLWFSASSNGIIIVGLEVPKCHYSRSTRSRTWSRTWSRTCQKLDQLGLSSCCGRRSGPLGNKLTE